MNAVNILRALVAAAALALAVPVSAAPRLDAPATPGMAAKAQCILDHLPSDERARMLEAAKTDLMRALELGKFSSDSLGTAYSACPMGDSDPSDVAAYTVGMMVQSVAETWIQTNRGIDATTLDAAWTGLDASDRRKLARNAKEHADLSLKSVLAFATRLGIQDELDSNKPLYAAIMTYAAGRALRDAYGDFV